MLESTFRIQDNYHKRKKNIRFDEYNNVFFTLQTLPNAMIKFYNLSHEETKGVVKFVIKLDERSILKYKLKSVFITLMNKDLEQKKPEDIDDEEG